MSDIEIGEHGTSYSTSKGIALFRLIAMRSGVKAEAKGLKFRRSITAQAKRELGIKGNRNKVLAVLDAEIETAKAQVEITRT